MISLTNIFKKFEEAMASSAFAEEGEFEMARQFLKKGGKTHKRVLLGTDEQEIDPKFIGYALKLCQRVEAGLEILHLVRDQKRGGSGQAPVASATGATHLRCMLRKMGIVYNQINTSGHLEKELVSQVAGRRDILMVVLGARRGGRLRELKAMAEAMGRLHCPLVVYEGSP